MRRKNGICIAEKLHSEGEFQGIIIPEVNISFEKIHIKEGYYNKNGEYSIMNLGTEKIPEGIGLKTFKKIIYGRATIFFLL